MLQLRPYESGDAARILGWVSDEAALCRWSADTYPKYPVLPDEMNRCYESLLRSDSFLPMTAVENGEIAGHFAFWRRSENELRLGYVIVDDARRGTGLGRKMILHAVRYAFETLRAEKVTLGVFENNPAAQRCYRSAGFRDIELKEKKIYHVCGEDWSCLEMEILRPAPR